MLNTPHQSRNTRSKSDGIRRNKARDRLFQQHRQGKLRLKLPVEIKSERDLYLEMLEVLFNQYDIDAGA